MAARPALWMRRPCFLSHHAVQLDAFFVPASFTGIFIAIFVGWVMKRENVLEELEMNEGWVLKAWYFLLKFLSPVLVGVVFVASVFFGVT